ncbi:hypothetical protein ACRE_028870 [Hapsidospora chrysogenum ATCC 11550]|uniref:B-block binding subunit of TFIIIC domain-containing protein n=1 Tax=Hapsidospora chrysogenum (strain ATCC 11550 / CBS 779.69 / DSM 880 / IAM 14645 / JCM 23072 / IMI 49137) TaxID=857340 RepID=A0A086TA82_HAPC1|nr:hypothetical protein ACRE_028870 [Hapsidospora chrysogenum ATCC 11550]
MAWDLEGLIAGLVVFISCAGEQGYPVAELVYAIRQSLRASLDGPQVPDPGTEGTGDEHVASLRATATVWAWLVQRPDVFVGPDRKYNHLALEEVLGLSRPAGSEHIEDVPESSSEDRIAAPSNEPRTSQPHTGGHGPRGDIRVTVSEDTMWESITGHGVDYKRLPLSEWQCLLGIASTMRRGIVQGDLRRLVGQDKRSVPKRTDALAKKGYIIKRTTLVTGAKTSKMWLAQFAPILIRDDGDVDRQVTAGMDLSPSFLTANLDPVPWHTRWTGESIDYSALATTIVATSKAWGTIRMSDMKSKLGVLRLRWQMRVLSKTCRFLSARGVIQYVAAALEHKIYKDCIRYVRDMDSRDWTMYLIAGKRRLGEIPDGEDGLATENAGPSSLTTLVQWSPDEHLPQYITRTARISGTVGFSNPDLYFLTLGSSFSRFISSLTSTMATSTVQPPHLEQLQLRSELDRSGKVAFFRYFLHPGVDSEDSPAAVQDPDSSSSLYGFPPTSAEAGQMDGTLSLSRVCSKLAPPRGRPPKLQPQRGVTTEASPQHVDEDQPATPPQPKVAARQGGPPKQRSQRVATPEPSLNQDEDHRTSPPQPEVKRTRGRPRKQQPETAVTLEAGPQQDEEDHQPPPPQLEVKRKRGRPRKQQPETATTLEAGPQQDEEDHQPPPPQLEVKRKRGRPRKQQPPRASTPETGPQSAEEKHPDTPHQLEVALKVTPRSLRAVLRSSAANIGLVDLNMIRDISHIGPVHKSDSSKPNGVATEDLNAVEGTPAPYVNTAERVPLFVVAPILWDEEMVMVMILDLIVIIVLIVTQVLVLDEVAVVDVDADVALVVVVAVAEVRPGEGEVLE